MRLAWLFVRSRRAGQAAAGIAVLGVLAWGWGWWQGDDAMALRLALILFPLAVACLVGAGAGSPFGEAERASGYALPALRLSQLGGLLAMGMVVFVAVTGSWRVADASWLCARNLAGFIGLALLCARMLGGRLSWLLPSVWGLPTLFAVDAAGGHVARWAWPAQPGRVVWVAALAGALVVAGMVVVSRSGAAMSRTKWRSRERPQERPHPRPLSQRWERGAGAVSRALTYSVKNRK